LIVPEKREKEKIENEKGKNESKRVMSESV